MIRTVVKRYIDLGADGYGGCPFCDDKERHFYASDVHEDWFCTACGREGRLLDFVAAYEQCTKEDVIALLNKLGVVSDVCLAIMADVKWLHDHVETISVSVSDLLRVVKAGVAASPESKVVDK